MHTSRNSGPISKLPNELLCIIFSFHQHHVRLLWGRPNVKWIVVSHVSRTWRDAALNYAKLWTDIPFFSPKWIPEMLRRSKNASLTISLSTDICSRRAFQAFCDVIRTNSHRVGDLTLEKIEKSCILEDLFEGVPHSSMSRLQSLVITPANLYYSGNFKHFDVLRFFEKYIGDALDLRRVDVFWTAAWDSRVLGDLTHLTVRNESMTEPPPSGQFFDAIRRMPRLQELQVYDVVFPLCSNLPNPAPEDIIDLPLLRTLLLSGTVLETTSFLRHIRIPPCCSVDINCAGSDLSPSSSAGLISSLRDLCFTPPSSDNPVLSIQFLQLGNLDFWATLPRDVKIASDSFVSPLPNRSPFLPVPLLISPPVHDFPFLAISFPRYRANPALTESTLIGALSTFPCENLTTLSLAFTSPPEVVNDYLFLDALGKQPKLENIHVETGFMQQFLDYMAARTDASNIAFPALRILHFSGDYYCRGRDRAFPVQELQRFVRQRKELGVGLRVLAIHHKCCLLKTSDIEIFGNLVDEVSCGGAESNSELGSRSSRWL